MQKRQKGDAGYFRYERFRRSLLALILLLPSLLLFIIGIMRYGSNRNLLTVIAMVLLIPFGILVVSAVMVFLQKPIAAEDLRKIEAHKGDLLMAYELYVTHEKASTLLDAVAICGGEVAAYVSSKKGDASFTATYIEKALRAEGLPARVHIFTDLDAFLARLDGLNEHAGTLRKEARFRPNPNYPEDTGEELIWRTLCLISL